MTRDPKLYRLPRGWWLRETVRDLRIIWCRWRTGHEFITHRSLYDGAPVSVSCRHCPFLGPGE